jgi:hypothetical protein
MLDHIEPELIPGTEILLASDQGYGRHSSSNEELVLVPTPSDQANDPLVKKKNLLSCLEKIC